MSINSYCREYRISKGKTLKDVSNWDKIKSLSDFEMGRSSNIYHFEKYVSLAMSLNDIKGFADGLFNIEGKNG